MSFFQSIGIWLLFMPVLAFVSYGAYLYAGKKQGKPIPPSTTAAVVLGFIVWFVVFIWIVLD